MYAQSDIDGAVAAGAITPEAAEALRRHVAATSATPAVDEESFRLLTGFNDIFVSIALALVLVAVAWLGQSAWPPLGGVAVAAVAWALAEYFTRVRRMALPSILLLVVFVAGVASALAVLAAINAAAIGRWAAGDQDVQNRIVLAIASVVAAVTAAAAWTHWRRFAVPITVAAGAVAVVGVVLSLVTSLVPAAREAVIPLVLLAGLATFAFAMRWDLSDRERRTRRSDVAFWLHLAAAPMIAHALFHMLGVFDGAIGLGMAAVVLALYLGFAFVALAVDRRALLVSSLAYVLYALVSLFRSAGAVELAWALTALVIGSALLTLSAFWQPMRRRVVGTLGRIGAKLPPVQVVPA